MPGAWICDKCQFILQKSIMSAKTGNVYANNEPFNEKCPNDGTLMRPYTWREANERLYQALILEQKRMNWLDQNRSFVADYKYNLGPFKIGELRKLADAGLAADKKKDHIG